MKTTGFISADEGFHHCIHELYRTSVSRHLILEIFGAAGAGTMVSHAVAV